ncbi:thioredoxin family protein [Fulvivirgaceae bacterium BMA10]|uniref:Thioredoxin family protein n=1 Tax=Splendidivirga corallicola TaxID=3051826 RepID=A0ABT8KUC2_9BACT|nr:thioredoxin family protein [Fulvivirgaceae bacterium BMA10]
MRTKLYILIFFLFTTSGHIFAQQVKTITGFTLINAADKKEISLESFKQAKGIVLVFTSNFCPYSKLYEKRILDLHHAYGNKGIQFLLINPNDPVKSKDDSIEEMAKKAREKQFKFPYLADKDQKVVKLLGASKTPEAYLLRFKGGKFEVFYHGAIDDNPQVPQDVSKNYLKDAIEALQSGRAVPIADVRPTGCMIKKN